MYAHNDLKSGGPEYPIPDTVTRCALSGVSRSLYSLNDTCGWKDWVDVFRLYVVDHERTRQESLNECIRAVNTDGRLEAVESIVKPIATTSKMRP